ncbi:MAG: FAD-binding protein [Bacteroidia bacterium]|nr:FAD-binding protein [Bacteroidia bacterium]
MYQEIQLSLPPELLHNAQETQKRIAKIAGVAENSITFFKLLRKAVDARKKPVLFSLKYGVWIEENPDEEEGFEPVLRNVTNAEPVHIAGLGPAGLFAALQLIEMGLKPVLIERGKDVRARRRDLAVLNKEGVVNPESNYCFGEGGAGTFSDGKLYTRSTKRGDTLKVLQLFHYFGASAEILLDTHPHIGTNKLPGIIQNIREKIIECGGEIHFNTRLTGILTQNNQITGIEINGGEKWKVNALILATGHSARDIFTLLHRQNILIEAKPFAMGVRVEHPQSIIDSIQYHCSVRHENLPAASYNLVKQVQDKGVYSFCMCPGGIICPAATADDIVVVNGWSPSKRDSPYANSGIVVAIETQDYLSAQNPSPLDGIHYQQKVERQAYISGGGKQVAPAQRLADFVNGRFSASLPECSYLPGIRSVNMKEVLPPLISKRLREGFSMFGKMMKGYLTNEAVIVGVESRTSSPVRIPRDNQTLMHPQVSGLFPCGEGAGYAGGIMSAAIDGMRCAAAAGRK